MATNTRVVHATTEQVWSVLADGWLYPVWVVGASRMREVDDTWPAVGSRLHHSFGVWPALIDDNTEVVEATPGAMLGMRARGWPLGEARVIIRLRALGAETEVRIDEDAVSGPGRLVPEPVRAVAIRWRNAETLERLAYIAERHA
jgi:Polyketide cyclase / dehydrase and lipid transport